MTPEQVKQALREDFNCDLDKSHEYDLACDINDGLVIWKKTMLDHDGFVSSHGTIFNRNKLGISAQWDSVHQMYIFKGLRS
jgi:hypothetical protein